DLGQKFHKKDGFLMFDDSEIGKLSEEKELKQFVDDELETLLGPYNTPEGEKELSEDPELKKLKERVDRFKEYKNTLEGRKDPLNKNTGDPMTLLQFISWCINTYEAERYMVVLAGHGSGAVEDFLLKDETARDSLTLHELRDGFQMVQKILQKPNLLEIKKDKKPRIDILGMDSCLMNMAEVYCQLGRNDDPGVDLAHFL